MRYYLSDRFILKWLETPAVYDIKGDELYELDEEGFEFLKGCASLEGCSANILDKGFLNYCLSDGILTSERIDAKMPLLIKSPVPSLRYLELQITDKCNLRCRHCYIGKPENNELTLEEIKKILDEFQEMQGLRLLITGGEPLMHSKFNEINSILPEYMLRKILFTNGLLLNSRLIKRLNVEEIQFSIDGMEQGHEALRGKGTYKLVMEGIREAMEAGFLVSVATMIHRENLGEFEEMEALFKEIGIKDWTVDVPCVSGNLKDYPLLQPPPEIAGRYLNYGFGEGLHGGGEGYACGLHLMSVLANGKVCKCAFYSNSPAGDIKEGLRKNWQRIKPVRLDELECFDMACQFIDACRGGCRYRAEINQMRNAECKMRNEKLKKDIYKCCGHGIIKT